VLAANLFEINGVPVAEFVTVSAAVAAAVLVRVEVVRVVEVTRATLPDPVEASQDATVPFENKSVLFAPIAVRPVPPFATGSAVPERVIASVPDEVIGEPDMERNAGTDAATDVTVPVVGVVQTIAAPEDVSTCPFVPRVVRPVPPFATGSAVPERVIASVPDEVIGEPDMERNSGTDAATEVTDPPDTVAHVGRFETRVRTCPFVPAGMLTNSFDPFVRTRVEAVRDGIITAPVSEIENLEEPKPPTILLIRNSCDVPFDCPIVHSHTPPLFERWYLA
jgi:hypothetical protein